MMNGFPGSGYGPADLPDSVGSFGGDVTMSTLDQGAMGGAAPFDGDTLDDIINQNSQEMERRRSMHPLQRTVGASPDNRRSSMVEFGPGMAGNPAAYQFNLPPQSEGQMLDNQASMLADPSMLPRGGRRQSTGDLEGGQNRFPLSTYGFEGMALPSFPPGLPNSGSMGMEAGDNFMSSSITIPMDFQADSLPGVGADVTSMNMFPQQSYQSAYMTSPLHGNFPGSFETRSNVQRDGPTPRPSSNKSPAGPISGMDIANTRHMDGASMTGSMSSRNMPVSAAAPIPTHQSMPDFGSPSEAPGDPVFTSIATSGKTPFPTNNLYTENNMSLSTPPHFKASPSQSPYPNAYSSSGFDMLNILMRVATRPNPEINIGAVDMSCAFVVCDVSQHDLPIHEILGRNCRFLQAPDGQVQPGVKRKYVDDDAVLYLKNMTVSRKEAQISIINYRKGGQPFMNLLTMIPITWEPEGDYRYFVGFQVDLVEQPNSVTNKNPDGSYTINYQRGFLPRYVFQTPENNPQYSDMGQTIGRDDVSAVLSTLGSGPSELTKRIWDKVLLENTDDVVHVLSLKGLFLYLSPSSRKVLEYDAKELVGTALSSVCHPSDIVPVTRELKDTAAGSPVNVVFRFRRKHSGYTWFESHGTLHAEQGKGRKCIILVGRERPVYALSRNDIKGAGGIGENELWTKLSTSGMFLFISSNVKTLLDRHPEELIGTSMQALMRPESKATFGSILDLTRTGKRAAFKHEMQNKRGQDLQAHTTIYPGDAVEGQKPTFLVAQTRLLKLTRGSVGFPPHREKSDPSTISSAAFSGSPNHQIARRTNSSAHSASSTTSMSPAADSAMTRPGGAGLPIGSQDLALASEDNVFEELKTTRSTSWQFELRQMEKRNRSLQEELQSLISMKKKRKRRKGTGQTQKDCANCHTTVTPEWRRGPSGNRDLCNSCGLRWAKQNGRVSPRTSSHHSKGNVSPAQASAGTSGASKVNRSPSSLSGHGKSSPQQNQADIQAAKANRMDTSALQGLSAGVPPKIEEGEEPD